MDIHPHGFIQHKKHDDINNYTTTWPLVPKQMNMIMETKDANLIPYMIFHNED